MLENILKEFKKKFEILQGLIINNSLNFEEAKIEINKFVFALSTIKASLVKNETAFSAAQVRKVQSFEEEILEFRRNLANLYDGIEEENILVTEIKESIPETIRTDALEEEPTLEV